MYDQMCVHCPSNTCVCVYIIWDPTGNCMTGFFSLFCNIEFCNISPIRQVVTHSLSLILLSSNALCSSNFAPNQDPGASMGSNFSEYSTTTNASETEGDSTEFEQSGASQFDFNGYNKMVRLFLVTISEVLEPFQKIL